MDDYKLYSTEEQVRNTMLLVCDPSHEMTIEERREVLRALGLVKDPKHTEMVRKVGT